MAKNFNVYDTVKNIYDLKYDWHKADSEGNDTGRTTAANNATRYYQQLRDNGYSDIADKLGKSNYEQSKTILDTVAKYGKTPANDYLKPYSNNYGFNVDDLYKYDAKTGDAYFAGKNIGKPDAVIDGVTYWSDTASLDNAVSDYVKRSGTARTNKTLSGINSEEVREKINSLFGTQASDRTMMTDKYTNLENYIYDHNPYETDIGKSIMEGYTWKGQQASDNEIASGAASNGGNIDSFAAANAARQQLAFTNAGKQAVLNDHNARIANVQKTLGDMGVYLQNQDIGMQNTINLQQSEAQRLFENDETEKKNELDKNIAISEITGTVPASMLYANNPFFNADGTLRDESIDYKKEIDKAVAAGDSERAEYARQARGYKIYNNYAKWGKYAADGDYSIPGTRQTESARQFDAQIAAADRENKDDNASAERINAANNANEIKLAEMSKTSPVNYEDIYSMLTQSKAENISKEEALYMIANHYGYSSDAYKYASANIDSIYKDGSAFA